jgi:hypothetical protein
MAFLTMEDSACGRMSAKRRSPPRFPCIYAVFSACITPSSKLPERPWKRSNLSPEPVPKMIRGGPPCAFREAFAECLT